MTNRLRHYHLGCGESLCTHYSLLGKENRIEFRQDNRFAKQSERHKLKQERVKG